MTSRTLGCTQFVQSYDPHALFRDAVALTCERTLNVTLKACREAFHLIYVAKAEARELLPAREGPRSAQSWS